MPEKKLTYDELVERNRRLANMLIRRNEEFEQTLRAEVKKAKAQAWDEGCNAGYDDRLNEEWGGGLSSINPYKEES